MVAKLFIKTIRSIANALKFIIHVSITKDIVRNFLFLFGII